MSHLGELPREAPYAASNVDFYGKITVYRPLEEGFRAFEAGIQAGFGQALDFRFTVVFDLEEVERGLIFCVCIAINPHAPVHEKGRFESGNGTRVHQCLCNNRRKSSLGKIGCCN